MRKNKQEVVVITVQEAKRRLLTCALSHLGYSEGSNNWNKFAENADLRAMYGWYPQNQPWCDIFVDTVFIEAFGLDLACGLTYQPKGAGSALCSASANYYKQHNAWYSSPEEGDQVFFYSGGDINHTGIVESVSGGTVNTIEGNSSDSVARRSYSTGSGYIAGYGRPNWSLIATSNTQTSSHKMKYGDNNKPLQCFMTQSTCYRGTSKMEIKGVLWHSTGANNPWLKRYVQPDDNAPNKDQLIAKLGQNQYRNDWNHISVEAGLNAWVGKLEDGTVTAVQTMPWDYKPWGCGAGSMGSCNNGWIQFEVCEDSLTDKAYFDAAYQEAIQLTAYLCKLYSINPKGYVGNIPTILCHQDSYRYGMGSNHSDVYNWFNRYGKTMDDVRSDVAALTGNISGGSGQQSQTDGSRPMLKPGDKNSYVTELQKALLKLGYGLPKYGADGDFGSETEAAVKAFQSANKLEVDGIVGQATWGAIDKALSGVNSVPPHGEPSAGQADGQQQANDNQSFKPGDVVSIKNGAVYYTGKTVPPWVTAKTWVIQSVSGNRAVINKSYDGKNSINSPIDVKYLKLQSSAQTPTSNETSVTVGSEVTFTGSRHYISAASTLALPCKAGRAKVTKICDRDGIAHPYHLVAVPGLGSTVHGWVSSEDIQEARRHGEKE